MTTPAKPDHGLTSDEVEALRQHCMDFHDLQPHSHSKFDGLVLVRWHHKEHAVRGNLDHQELSLKLKPKATIDIRPTTTDPKKALANKYRALRLDRQSVANRGGPPELIERLTIDMIKTADELAVLVLRS